MKFLIKLMKIANFLDKKGLYKEASGIDLILKQAIENWEYYGFKSPEEYEDFKKTKKQRLEPQQTEDPEYLDIMHVADILVNRAGGCVPPRGPYRINDDSIEFYSFSTPGFDDDELDKTLIKELINLGFTGTLQPFKQIGDFKMVYEPLYYAPDPRWDEYDQSMDYYDAWGSDYGPPKQPEYGRPLGGGEWYIYSKNTQALDRLYDELARQCGIEEDYIVDPYMIPDNQLNIENEGAIRGESPVGGGYSMLGIDEAQRADDSQTKRLFEKTNTLYFKSSVSPDLSFIIMGSYPKGGPNKDGTGYTYFICVESEKDPEYYYCCGKNFDSEDEVIKAAEEFSNSLSASDIEKSNDWGKMTTYMEQDNVDIAARSNGLQGNSVTDNQNSGMFQGFSDSYFYRGPGSIEDNR